MTETGSVRSSPGWTSLWGVMARPQASTRAIQQPLAAPPSINVSALIEALPDPTIVTDLNGVVDVANSRAKNLFQRLEPGAPLSFAVRNPELVDALARVAGDGVRKTVIILDRVPVERTFEVTVSLMTAIESRLVIVVHDLSERQRLEKMRVDFVANASHELRTPLATLSGFIETLQGAARSDPAARDRFLEIMRQQAYRMSRLIDDLLSLSRIELAAHVRPNDQVDLGGIISETLDALAPRANELGVTIERHLPDTSLFIAGDRDELVRVAENLVENAIKYGFEGGRVIVTLERAGTIQRPTAVLSVRDFGPGIAEEHIPRLTERFYRVDVATSRNLGGTGLGLAIVKHIVARHRARLDIESRLGEGATFKVTFEANR